ncbi:hypothetical protein K1719_047488 [Acacia pycnantha]|nr:hypothetical protein K1719_047488 [Acacia pycnantha]
MATEVAINRTQEPNNADVKLYYTETKRSTCNASVSLKLGVKTNFKTGIPFIEEGKIEISAKFGGAYQWGESQTSSIVVETVYERDTLTNGQQVTYVNMDDDIYTGINSFNFRCESKQEKL